MVDGSKIINEVMRLFKVIAIELNERKQDFRRSIV